jgi:hypothetical protein
VVGFSASTACWGLLEVRTVTELVDDHLQEMGSCFSFSLSQKLLSFMVFQVALVPFMGMRGVGFKIHSDPSAFLTWPCHYRLLIGEIVVTVLFIDLLMHKL